MRGEPKSQAHIVSEGIVESYGTANISGTHPAFPPLLSECTHVFATKRNIYPPRPMTALYALALGGDLGSGGIG